ncbi:cytochrome P450 [Actinoplanes sp. NBRC 101535]|uniref:cytochrome P450 n=1 Tax=Actinoplanes sp. NBRC 101535 TaxID=3032196 RepID=UPI0024A5D18D|nr:cytochrome P450 [Actinoplanes sp. NBRC 101535]GLY02585.1 cytochrome P450 [Actinoplanes sp. NBRC 101535]
MEIAFDDPGFVLDPYPMMATLRASAPLSWHAPTSRFLASSHATANAVLRDRRLGRFWTDLEPAAVYEPFNLLHRHQMMENEPPVHTRLRSLVAQAFGRGHVERLRAGIKPPSMGTEFDLISDVAEPLAVTVIAELLGVPAADRPRLRPWSAAIVRMYEVSRTPAVEAAAIEASREFADYLAHLAAARRADPRDDLITHLTGVGLTGDELIASVILLLNAGHEASVNGLGNGVVALLEHPAQLARLRADRSLVVTAVEEMLRYDSPSQLFVRTAAADVTVGGVTVPAGAEVAALLGAANRDPAVFAAPDRFDVGRVPNPHLSFGAGLHFCLGAPLARIELQSALEALLDLPALEFAGPPVRHPSFVLRGWSAVPLTTS